MRSLALLVMSLTFVACGTPATSPPDTVSTADSAAADSGLTDAFVDAVAPDVDAAAPDVDAHETSDAALDALDVTPDASDADVPACVCPDGTPCDVGTGKCVDPVFPRQCMPCNTAADCNPTGGDANICMSIHSGFKCGMDSYDLLDGSFCMARCPALGACPAASHCEAVALVKYLPATTSVCMPDGGHCLCHDAWAAAGKSTACNKTNDLYGTCASTRQCQFDKVSGAAMLTPCNVPDPDMEKCGDNIDNNCDGKTDEPGASGCTSWFPDADGDGYGTWKGGSCTCTAPPPGTASFAGDCDDGNPAIHPGVPEICDGLDNNCNGTTDESGSPGCTLRFHDLDGDGYGSPNDSACLCPSTVTSSWLLQAGDCNDTPGVGAAINPTATEACDGVDNNCDGKTDGENAAGCKLYFPDQDGDGYGIAGAGKCLCAGTFMYCADLAGDCNDTAAAINPDAGEVCDGLDNDCNGATDDGTASDACLSGVCVDGACTTVCPSGYVDLNASATDGCECAVGPSSAGATCGGGANLGDLPEGSTLTVSGQIVPGEAGDWYSFKAIDLPEVSTQTNCDEFDVHIAFSSNPGDAFVFDVYRGACCADDQVCSGETVHTWSVNFYGPTPFGPKSTTNAKGGGGYTPSPVPEAGGECGCVAPNAVSGKKCSWDWESQNVGCGPHGYPGLNLCVDNSAPYRVRVYRKPGAPHVCDSYTLQASNTPGGVPPNP